MKNKIAKAVISSIMGVEPKDIMVLDLDTDFAVVYYLVGNEKIKYKVKSTGSKAVWGTLGGRWRDHELESTISFREIQDELLISEKFTDGSLINNTFTLKDL